MCATGLSLTGDDLLTAAELADAEAAAAWTTGRRAGAAGRATGKAGDDAA